MGAGVSAEDRRKDILRQIAKFPEGLRPYEVRMPLSSAAICDYVRQLHREKLLDTVMVRKTNGTSNKPILRYVINDAGRKELEP